MLHQRSGARPRTTLAAAATLLMTALISACGSGNDVSGSKGAGGGAGGPTGSTGSTGSGGSGGSSPDAGATPCWPFDQPALATLRASSHKVFAHYFSPFPLSIDNQPPDKDYYAVNYLSPAGEGDKWSFCGGFIRERPLPVEPGAEGSDWVGRNFDIEVRRAVTMGLDGFTFDILTTNGVLWDRLKELLDSAQRVDGGFKIALMPDMYSTFHGTDAEARAQFVSAIKEVASHPAVYRLTDGRLVISPFATDARTPDWWVSVIDELKSAGIEVALVALYVSPWGNNTKDLKAKVPSLYGTSSWGPRSLEGGLGMKGSAKDAHDLGVLWMAPVAPQDSRPKDLIFTEATNSAAFRALWESAIDGGADWVQLITWNDYSEDSEISPSSQIHGAFYDLSAYYATWFKTGSPPKIVRDALYYFHRAQSMSAAPDLTKQKKAYEAVNGTTAVDDIELVAMLTAPGTLEIAIGGKTQKKDVGAGMQTFQVPLEEGTPTFRLVRGGATVTEVTSSSPISNTIVYQDPLYHAGGSMTCAD